MSSNTPYPTGNGLRALGRWIAIAIVISAFTIASTIERIKLDSQTIYVKGSSERQITSDVGILTFYYSARAEKLPEANEKLSQYTDEIIKFLAKQGFSDSEITRIITSIQTKYKKDEKGNDTSEIQQYAVQSGFTIKSSDVNKISATSIAVSELISKDIDVRVTDVKFMVSDLSKLKKDMLSEAITNAKERADIIAKGAGSSIGRLHWASQGIFQITTPYAPNVSDYGEYDTSTIEKTIKAVISATFKIK